MGGEASDEYAEDSVIRHCITEGVPERLPDAEVIHLRAKDLPACELLARARELSKRWRGTLLINDRMDVCLAAGAAGVHLPAQRIAPRVLKARFGEQLQIGVSCHALDEVLRAEQEGADYVYLSPIFVSLSKPGYGPALGLGALEEAAARVKIPVLALGGVTQENIAGCLKAGAAGVAGISLFGG
jgi:thiamine-phosphate pyrophosphorylase